MIGAPVAVCQTRAVPSALAVTIRVPSRLSSTAATGPPWRTAATTDRAVAARSSMRRPGSSMPCSRAATRYGIARWKWPSTTAWRPTSRYCSPSSWTAFRRSISACLRWASASARCSSAMPAWRRAITARVAVTVANVARPTTTAAIRRRHRQRARISASRLASISAVTCALSPSSRAASVRRHTIAAASSPSSSSPLAPRPRAIHSSALAWIWRRRCSSARRASTHAANGGHAVIKTS
ncbi:MAG: hypothetical protein E6J90_35185, partial [Deltaproteobacteria bacterium]